MTLLTTSSIKGRLIVNSGLLLFLFVLALVVHQVALNRIESAFILVEENQRHYDAKAWEIKTGMLGIELAVHDFLVHRNLVQAREVEQGLAEVVRLTGDIRQYANAHGNRQFADLAVAIANFTSSYEDLFRQMRSAEIRRGMNEENGIMGAMRVAAHRLETTEIVEHGLGQVLEALLRVNAILRADDGSDLNSRVEAMDRAQVKFVQLFNNHVPNTEANQDLYRLFEAYQLTIHHYFVAASAPDKSPDLLAAEERASQGFIALSRRVLQNHVPNVAALVMSIRRNEKDYIQRHEEEYIVKTHSAIQDLRDTFANSEVSQDHIASANYVLDEYLKNFDALVSVDREIAGLNERLLDEASSVDDAVEAILIAAIRAAEQEEQQARERSWRASLAAFSICLVALLLGVWLSISINRSINTPLKKVLDALALIAQGDYSARIVNLAVDEIGHLGRIFNRMAEAIGNNQWQANGRNQLAELLREDKSEERLCRDAIVFLAQYLGALAGAFYVRRADGRLTLSASVSLSAMKDLPVSFEPGQGLVGEVALSRQLLVVNGLPPDYLRLESGLGQTAPVSLLVLPVIWLNGVQGVIELAACSPFSEETRVFLAEAAESIAIALYSSRQRKNTLDLLDETQRQAAVLQRQQEELRAANEELEDQTQSLRRNEEELKCNQEELQAANEELEEKSESLLRKNQDIERSNRELEEAWRDIDAQARELAAANRYKSEFLANMSHELRTPLNSLLLLARNLSQNKNGNLEPTQVESATIIHNSGQDLLRLINDILDLSKIEAGRMDIASEEISLRGLGDWLKSNMGHLVSEQGLDFVVEIDDTLPKAIVSDRMRIEQILRNLVGNAVKFTHQGSVTVRFQRPPSGLNLTRSALDPTQVIAIAVSDSGIGISPEQQLIIFDAFRQAEGGTARQYGGTGLGLSISNKLAHLLGGEIQLASQMGQGATFTVFLPLRRDVESPLGERVTDALTWPNPETQASAEVETLPVVADDRDHLVQGDKRLLIIEDDVNFASILLAQGREKGFKGLVALTAGQGLRLAKQYTPGAIILDIRLPDIDGWQVLETLKKDPALRHIPVHMISGQEKTLEAFKKGAIGFLTKPVSEADLETAFVCLEDALSRQMKKLLVVEDDSYIQQAIAELIGNGDVTVTGVMSGEEAIAQLCANKYDCMVLDIGLPDMTGFELLDRLSRDETIEIPPVIIYTGRELTREEGGGLAKYTDTVIIKGVKSEERLLDETALFLHRVVSKLPLEKRKMIASLYDQDTMFHDKRIMVVDDDMRNAFALSRILEQRGMKIILANDGRHAMELLAQESSVDLILMDIMMPLMDGYQTIAAIRDQGQFWNLPIIALTAKALPEDKEKCMAAGASDYLAKPVNEDRLLAMMRVWLYR